jgi:hypothetical protein
MRGVSVGDRASSCVQKKAKFSSAVAIGLNKSDHGTLQNMRDKFMQGERYILCSLCNAILQMNVRPVDC